jgi:hypothetical protein
MASILDSAIEDVVAIATSSERHLFAVDWIMELKRALESLGERFGAESLSIDSSGWIRILAAPPGSDLLRPMLLSRSEAIFLSMHDVTEADLFADRLPDGWPYPKQQVSVRFQAWNRSSGEAYWIDSGETVQRLGCRMEHVLRFFMPQKPERGSLETWGSAYTRSVRPPRPE